MYIVSVRLSANVATPNLLLASCDLFCLPFSLLFWLPLLLFSALPFCACYGVLFAGASSEKIFLDQVRFGDEQSVFELVLRGGIDDLVYVLQFVLLVRHGVYAAGGMLYLLLLDV